jgi:hypothetical protein
MRCVRLTRLFVQISGSNCVMQLLQMICFKTTDKQRVTRAHDSRGVIQQAGQQYENPYELKSREYLCK